MTRSGLFQTGTISAKNHACRSLVWPVLPFAPATRDVHTDPGGSEIGNWQFLKALGFLIYRSLPFEKLSFPHHDSCRKFRYLCHFEIKKRNADRLSHIFITH